MRRFVFVVCVICSLAASVSAQPRQQLLARLTTLQKQGYMFGHQDDPFYGLTWSGIDDPARPEYGRSDVKETCGDYPAVMGFDLGGIEMGDAKNLDSVPFTRIREELLAHVERGGIVTLSWHPRNPLTGGTAWDNTDTTVVASILSGGKMHGKFAQWMKNVRDFLATLKDKDDKKVPIIFRPWHENNGGWFWWGAKQCTPKEFNALWRMLQDYLVSEGFDNLVWSWSPNLGVANDGSMKYYPGDDRIDLIGLDAYQWGTEQDFVRQFNADMQLVSSFAKQHQKLFALTECGLKNLTDPTWWTRVLKPQLDKYPLSYFLVWRNAKHEYFGPAPGEENAPYFNEMVRSEKVLMLEDVSSRRDFVVQYDGQLWLRDEPYRFVGTNFWYGPILASEGQGGDRQRLQRELDNLHVLGLNNLRILVGSDGQQGVTTKVEPTLQKAPGVYNDTLLAGLDYLLCEMGKRGMKAVLYLNNSWEWSGGYGFYLEHAGLGKAPRPNEAGYEAYMRHVAQFATSEKAHQLFYDYVRFILSRQNRYTSLLYKDDPTIMAWQIGNEPRAFGDKEKPSFARWLAESSALIRQLDSNHLISVGSEGIWGCEMDSALYVQICSDPNIDYLNAHVWPYNWSWVKKESLVADVPKACKNTSDYLRPHFEIARQLRKPLVIEEFGFPRDGFSFSPSSTTKARDAYYHYIFSLVQSEPTVAGCNFWAWGGEARPQHEQWQVGDPYMGDPAQEQQGLNSVFNTDETTLKLIPR